MATFRNEQELGAKLLQMKKELEQEKEKWAELSGELNVLLSQLKERHGIKTPESAEKEIAKKEKEIEKLWQELEQQTEEILREFEGLEND